MDSPWKIEFYTGSRREYRALPNDVRRDVADVLRLLRLDPNLPGTEPLELGSKIYRKAYLRGGWRMIYVASKPHRKIFVERIRLHDYSGFSD